jgi:predicted transcriptional regulator
MNKITSKELELLKICIEKERASAREIYEESLKERKRSYTTIKTLLDRMVDRGFLRRQMDGNAYIYTPTVTESQAVGKAIDEFVKSMLGNTVFPLFSYFAQKKKMKKEDLEEIRKLIDKAEEK